MVLDLISASYIGWPNPALLSLMIDCVFLCRDSAIQASLMTLAAPSIDTAKVRRISYSSKFSPSIWGNFQREFDELMFLTSSLLALSRTHASMALHSLNRSL